VDGRVIEENGLSIAGLGGCLRYKPGPNQYSQAQMRWRVLNLEFRIRTKRVRAGRKLDLFVTHAPPFGVAEAKDAAHVGFVAFLRFCSSTATYIRMGAFSLSGWSTAPASSTRCLRD
jgi:hypothetical protein